MYVCNMLIIAEDAHFTNVQSCCIATLVFYHVRDFIRIIVNGVGGVPEDVGRRGT